MTQFILHPQEDKNSRIAVLIPCYKDKLSASETASLNACIRHLGGYHVYFVSPVGLALTDLLSRYPNIKVRRFASSYFNDVASYNRLVLAEEFYQSFSEYDYVLIYQLDAYVFKDELQTWADKGYDYIGAPWISRKYSVGKMGRLTCHILMAFHRLICNTRKMRSYRCINMVGNGGLSLRKVSRMIYITHKYKEQIARQQRVNGHLYPEDVWLACELRGDDKLSTPPWKEALAFAVDKFPDYAYKVNGYALPFGCHAFCRPPHKNFWKTFC